MQFRFTHTVTVGVPGALDDQRLERRVHQRPLSAGDHFALETFHIHFDQYGLLAFEDFIEGGYFYGDGVWLVGIGGDMIFCAELPGETKGAFLRAERAIEQRNPVLQPIQAHVTVQV